MKSKLIPFNENQKWGCKNPEGEVIIEPKYSTIAEFYNGIAVVSIFVNDGFGGTVSYGSIDIKGEIIVPIKYDWVGKFSCGMIRIGNNTGSAKKQKYGFVDAFGNLKIKMKYFWVSDFSEDLAVFRKDAKAGFGFIDKKGKVVIKPNYKEANPFLNGKAKVVIDGKNVIININGEVIGLE